MQLSLLDLAQVSILQTPLLHLKEGFAKDFFSRIFPQPRWLLAAGNPATRFCAEKHSSNRSYALHRLSQWDGLAAVSSRPALALLRRTWPCRAEAKSSSRTGLRHRRRRSARAVPRCERRPAAGHPRAAAMAPVRESTPEPGQCHRLLPALGCGDTRFLGHEYLWLELCQESRFLPSPKTRLFTLFFYPINCYQRPLRSSDKLFPKSKLILLTMNLLL